MNSVLFNGDCLIIMEQLIKQNVKVDAIICDPPYGTSACSNWDKVLPMDKVWNLLKQLRSNNCPIVLFGNEPFSSRVRLSNIEEYKYDWKWEKPSGANFLNFKYQPSKVYEDIMVFGNCPTSYSKNETLRYNPQMEEGKPYTQKSGKQTTERQNTSVRSPIEQVVTVNDGVRYPRAILKFNKDKENFHKTQKPLALMEYLVKTYTDEGDIVMDFTMGSGTTGVACKNTNRKFIGMEIDKNYFDIAKERIGDY